LRGQPQEATTTLIADDLFDLQPRLGRKIIDTRTSIAVDLLRYDQSVVPESTQDDLEIRGRCSTEMKQLARSGGTVNKQIVNYAKITCYEFDFQYIFDG